MTVKELVEALVEALECYNQSYEIKIENERGDYSEIKDIIINTREKVIHIK